jgi:Tol biopolymer transport system component
VPTPPGIFSKVGGWIAYTDEPYQGGPHGIWAVDPSRANDPEALIQLSDRSGTPLAWSTDGSKLLIFRAGPPKGQHASWTGLFLLNADGTETRLVVNRSLKNSFCNVIVGGSFSPDGSQVVFATFCRGIYTVDAHGGRPRLVLASTRELRRDPLTGHERSLRTDLFAPAFSPDGTQIAYVDGLGDWGNNTLRVMNPDGTGVRVLVHDQAVGSSGCSQMLHPAWSPDGTHIAFSCVGGIWVIGADGSGLEKVIPNGIEPYWSPDGSRIAFEIGGWGSNARLAIANADGTHVQTFRRGARAGPWNPLPLSVSGEPNPTGSGLAAPLVYAIALVVLVAVLIGGRRARAKIATKR